MKEFTVGAAFEINGKVRKVTKVNSKSVYFGRVRFDIINDEETGTQYIMVDGERINADAINNAEETTTEIMKEETTMAENINNQAIEAEAAQEAEVKNDSQAAIDIINKVEAREEAAEAPKTEAPKYTEYVVMKADQKDTTLWWDIVRKQKGDNISDIINPLHEEDNPKFVALVAVDKVKKYLDDPTIKGMVQTVRDVTKKYAKVSGIDNPTAGQVAEVFATIIEAFSDGARKGSWIATPAAPTADDKVTTYCYGEAREWDSREAAIAFFTECIANSEGSEQSRYATIVAQLQSGKTYCTDEDAE